MKIPAVYPLCNRGSNMLDYEYLYLYITEEKAVVLDTAQQ